MNDQNDLSATNVFGVPQTRGTKEEAWHREQERRSYDVIRVRNPDNTDYSVEWDHRYHRIPANGTADVPRYIAVKYCKDKAVETINKLADKLHKEDLENRSKKGIPGFKDKWEENQETYMTSRYPKTNDKELLAKLYSEYWVGLVYEFGKDQPMGTTENYNSSLEENMTPIEEKILNDLQSRRVDSVEDSPVKKDVVFPTFDKTQDNPLAKAVTVDEEQKDDQTEG